MSESTHTTQKVFDVIAFARAGGLNPLDYVHSTKQIELINWEKLSDRELLWSSVGSNSWSTDLNFAQLISKEIERRVNLIIATNLTWEKITTSMLFRYAQDESHVEPQIQKKICDAVVPILIQAIENPNTKDEALSYAKYFPGLETYRKKYETTRQQENINRLEECMASGTIILPEETYVPHEYMTKWRDYVLEQVQNISDLSMLRTAFMRTHNDLETKTAIFKKLLATITDYDELLNEKFVHSVKMGGQIIERLYILYVYSAIRSFNQIHQLIQVFPISRHKNCLREEDRERTIKKWALHVLALAETPADVEFVREHYAESNNNYLFTERAHRLLEIQIASM